MWAQQLVRPGTFEMVDVPSLDAKQIQPEEVVLRVIGGGICGSDLPFFAGLVSAWFDDDAPLAPNVPGYPLHEVVGEVVASRSDRLPVGSVAVGWATGTNALAQFAVSHSESLLAVPGDQDPAEALTLQPLACVIETLRSLGDLSKLRVAVLGLGPFGLLFGHVAKSLGAATVVGVDRVDRSDVAHLFQIDELVHSRSDRWARTMVDDLRPDLVIEAIGHQTGTLTDAITAAAFGGRIFYFGVPDDAVYPLPMQQVFRKHLTLGGGVIGERRNGLVLADEYLRAHPELHKSYVTHTFPVSRAQEAFELAAVPARGRLKVQLDFSC